MPEENKIERPSPQSLELVTTIVEGFFKKVNVDVTANRIQMPTGAGWSILKGSAVIYIYVQKVCGTDTLRLVSPILYLPHDNLLAFYRRCLEVNYSMLSCAFAVDKDLLFVVSERAVEGVDDREFEVLMTQVGWVSDKFDDELAAEFNAKLASAQR